MRKFVLPGLFVTAVVAFLAVLIVGLSSSSNNGLADEVNAGHQPHVPSAQLPLQVVSGTGHRNLADYRGHYVMVDFFAGWCDACQADAGSVALAQKLLAADGGRVVGVTYQDSTSDAASYMKRYHLHFIVLHDPNGKLASAFGVDGVPETFIINPQGRVVAARTYQLTNHWVTTTLDRVLAARS